MARDGETQEKMNRGVMNKRLIMATFLVDYADGHSVTYSATRAGVNRRTIWRWRQEDPTFDEAFQDAREQGTDKYEEKLYDLAMQGNVTAITWGLRMRGRFGGPQVIQDPDGPVDASVEELAQRALDHGYVARAD